MAGHIAPGEGRGCGDTVVRFLEQGQQRVRCGTGRRVWVTRVVSAHTHADVALGEGNRLGGLWLTAGLEPEFPLWLGLISLPLTFVGDPRRFLPSLGPGPPRRARPRCWGEGVEARADSTGHKHVWRPQMPTGFPRPQLHSAVTGVAHAPHGDII